MGQSGFPEVPGPRGGGAGGGGVGGLSGDGIGWELAGRKKSCSRYFRFRCQFEAPPPQLPEPRCLKEVRGRRAWPVGLEEQPESGSRCPLSPRAPPRAAQREDLRAG